MPIDVSILSQFKPQQPEPLLNTLAQFEQIRGARQQQAAAYDEFRKDHPILNATAETVGAIPTAVASVVASSVGTGVG